MCACVSAKKLDTDQTLKKMKFSLLFSADFIAFFFNHTQHLGEVLTLGVLSPTYVVSEG